MALGVNIVSEFNAKGVEKAIKDFKRLETATDKTAFAMLTMDKAVTNGVKKLAKIGAVATVAAGIIGKQLVDAASDLEESISKVNVVFGESANEVHNFAKSAAQSMGISRQEALEAAGTYGNLLQAFGVSREAAAQMSTTMVQLAGDLASFNNVPIADALQAIRSGLSGESEPLKRFGVAINDVRLKEEALRMGLYKGKGTLDILAKTQAAYALILKDTALAQGDYARTSDGVANTQRSLQATFQDVKAELGMALIPVYQSLLGFINDKVMPVFREFAGIIGKDGVGAAFKYLGEKGLEAIGKLSGWGNFIYGLVAAFIALKVAVAAYTVAQGLATVAVVAFGVAWNATGIGLIVSLIALLIVGLVALIVRFKSLREVFIKTWNIIVDGFQKWINFALGIYEFFINKFIDGVNIIIRGWNKIPFTSKISEIEKVNLALDITAAKIDGLGRSTAGMTKRAIEEMEMRNITNPPGAGTGAGSGAGFASSAGAAMDKMKERLKKYADLLKSTGQLQKDLTAAVKNTTQANEKLAEANTKLAKAQQTFQQVAQGFGAGSRQALTATEEFNQAQRDQTRAGFDLEKARFAVVDAEKALAEARRSGNPTAIRQAEIDLAESILAVEERQIALRDATDATAEAQRRLNGTIEGFPEDSEEYKSALDELVDAQKEARDAVDAVADAKERELSITNQLIAANKQLAAVKKVGITKKQAKQIAKSMKASGVTITNEMWQTLGITPFAKGGIVTSPVNALIGEAGPEAVIPLDRFDRIMGGDTYNIHINSKIADDTLPDLLVAELRKFNRRSGAINIQVA